MVAKAPIVSFHIATPLPVGAVGGGGSRDALSLQYGGGGCQYAVVARGAPIGVFGQLGFGILGNHAHGKRMLLVEFEGNGRFKRDAG